MRFIYGVAVGMVLAVALVFIGCAHGPTAPPLPPLPDPTQPGWAMHADGGGQ